VADVALEGYVRAAYTPALEKAHSELLPHLARPRLSVGLDMIAMGRLIRHGGSAYVPQHMLAGLAGKGLIAVEDAPVLEQPVYLATHIRRRTDPIVRAAARSLQELAAAGKYGS
jgi:DNA-binding transcriptional LysR family regulator